MKARNMLFGFVAMILIILAGCGAGETEQSSEVNETPSAWEKIEESGKIVVGTEGTYFPVTYVDQETKELTGFDVEVVRELASRLGIEAEFKTMEFDGILPSLRSGTIDLAANDFTVTPEREEKFLFTEPYKYSYGSAIVREEDNSGIFSTEDLEGKKTGGSVTSNYADFARNNGAEVVAYSGTDGILNDILIGRIDAYLNDHLVLLQEIERYNRPGLKVAEDVKYEPNVGAFVMVKGNTEVKEKLDSVIQEMREDGTIKEIALKFYGADVSNPVELEETK
ncbi:transporter substrate-binding domain-containing protein [Bacillus solimangrovi]|uniref:Solute-binding protein family 3/N-terminal domain-containing protein n=1 Tax=Bacillus solimangrovi TaxID=1305675 RepID=A0A1E5LFU7_9BACI|nr:transporter substrate-binding domain-containing protein [Bacillus solimangrovi]OEH92940.1 hypothetical protein BFG57_14295 [Bacillus solimangrovi]